MIHKIISGGQTGVDRAALDFSIQHHIKCGGWCPKNRWAEDGKIDLKYPLTETAEKEPVYRTIKNIQMADGTLLIYKGTLDSGCIQTLYHAKKMDLPILCIDLSQKHSTNSIEKWIRSNKIITLNIAGPRESNSPGIYQQSLMFLNKLEFLY